MSFVVIINGIPHRFYTQVGDGLTQPHFVPLQPQPAEQPMDTPEDMAS